MAETPPVLTELPWNYGHGNDGEWWHQDADGLWQVVTRPGDYEAKLAAGTPYVATINPVTGWPYFAPATLTLIEAFGYGTGYGLGYGRD
jgi:hypothetical protein